MTKVSVVVPVYNNEKYIVQCINSLLKQSLSDLEIICVDDGSVDSSPDILEEIKKKDTRIKVIHKSNKGYGHTVNTGIENSSGEYIGIVDSDDYVSAEMYEFLYRKSMEHDLDFIKSDFYEIKSYRGKVYRKKITGFDDKKIYDTVIDPSIFTEAFNYITMNVWTGIFKKDFLNKNSIRFNETPGAAFQDNGFWFQTLCLAKRIMFSDRAFYRYRKDNPCSSVNDKSKVFDITYEYDHIKNFLIAHPDIFDLYYKQFVIQKYYAYMDTYMRIDRKYKLAFLKKCAEEFSNDLKNIEVSDEENSPVFYEMLRIIDSPKIYYYERSLDERNKEYEIMHADLERLKKITARC